MVCTTTYTYDARDRLTEERTDRTGGAIKVNTYTLSPAGNLVREDKHDKPPVRFSYKGNQLDEQLDDNFVPQFKYHYKNGDLDCVTRPSGNAGQCGTRVLDVVAEYAFDDYHRLQSSAKYNAGVETDSSSYVYDALDRVVEQQQKHASAADRNRTTTTTYLGLSNLATEEKQVYAGTRPTHTKSFSYDAAGHRITMTDQKGTDVAGAKDYTYGHDVHGSVSMLLDDTGAAKAAYGYTAYGDKEKDLTREADADFTDGENVDIDPLNSYRYSAKRLDSANGTIDMGVRRFGPDTSHFLQEDAFDGALHNLGLASDPLTQNRYSLAGGNPVSFVEVDGHMLRTDGGGGGSSTTESSSTTTTVTRPPITDVQSDNGSGYTGRTAPTWSPQQERAKDLAIDRQGIEEVSDTDWLIPEAKIGKTLGFAAKKADDLLGISKLWRKEGDDAAEAAAKKVKAISDDAASVGVKFDEGAASFDILKRDLGKAGKENGVQMNWHHLVEKNTVTRGQFPSQLVNNPANVRKIPAKVNSDLNAYYQRKFDWTEGMNVRDYIQKNMSFSDQYRFGEAMLNRALNNKLPGQ